VTRHRVALWVLLGGKLLGAWGLAWDIQWHLLVGRDTFWIAPHLMMYGGITAGLLVAFGALLLRLAGVAFGEPNASTGPAEASHIPMFAHLALVLAAGIWLPPPLVAWFQQVAGLLG